MKRIKTLSKETRGLYSSLLRSLFLCFVAFFTIVTATVAWFVSNSSVQSSNAPVSAYGERRFYLATKKSDKQGIYDYGNNLNEALKHFNRIGNEIANGLPSYSIGTSFINGNDGIEYIVGNDVSLMVNSVSNINNTVQNEHIGPGSRGELTFYIIPAVDGYNSVNIKMLLTPYGLQKSENGDINAQQLNNEIISRLLCGHIYLFKGKNDNGDYVNWIVPEVETDGSIRFSFSISSEWTKNSPIEITLYWVWPYRFENIVYEGQKDSVFQSEQAVNDFLVWINRNKEKIAYTNVSELVDASKTISNSEFSKWSNGYNSGDQYIGDRVAYLVWTVGTDE